MKGKSLKKREAEERGPSKRAPEAPEAPPRGRKSGAKGRTPHLDRGTIFTFYSYKGGTGRSMLLANVAWMLASSGARVLAVDWDLEAPGLHRYFAPFLPDPTLVTHDQGGLIDMVSEFALEAILPPDEGEEEGKEGEGEDEDWYLPLAEVGQYTVRLELPRALEEEYQRANGGHPFVLDLLPAGEQGAGYADRVNAFDWDSFYERMGGGVFLNAVGESMRESYDYILIDSRTGVSDTAGICTVQLPDALAICFTYNNQSILGAAAVADSVLAQRKERPLRILPVPCRVEDAEMSKLELARDAARARWLPIRERLPESYWFEVEVPYVPYHAYEETLACLSDRPGDRTSVLAAVAEVTRHLTDGAIESQPTIDETIRRRTAARFERSYHKALRTALAEPVESGPVQDMAAAAPRQRRKDWATASQESGEKSARLGRRAVLSVGLSVGVLLLLLVGSWAVWRNYTEEAAGESAESHRTNGDQELEDGDLRAALSSYGSSVQILEDLVREEPGNEARRQELAALRERIGDVHLRRGELPEAIRAYRAAVAHRQRLHDAEPSDLSRLAALAAAEKKVGDVLLRQERYAQAMQAYVNSLGDYQGIGEGDEEEAAHLPAVAELHRLIGGLWERQEQLPEAQTAYQQAIELHQRITREYPEDRARHLALADAYERLGSIHVRLNETTEALEAYRHSLQIREAVEDMPPPQEASLSAETRGLAQVFELLGDVYWARRDSQESTMAYRRSIELIEGMEESEENAEELRGALFRLHRKVGDVLRGLGALRDAIHEYKRSADFARALREANPESTEARLSFVDSEERLGDVLSVNGQEAEALLAYREAEAALSALIQSNPSRDDLRRRLSAIQISIGDLRYRAGQNEAAEEAYQSSVTLRRQIHERHLADPEPRYDLAVALDRLAQSRLARTEESGDAGAEAQQLLEDALSVVRPFSEGDRLSAAQQLEVLTWRGRLATLREGEYVGPIEMWASLDQEVMLQSGGSEHRLAQGTQCRLSIQQRPNPQSGQGCRASFVCDGHRIYGGEGSRDFACDFRAGPSPEVRGHDVATSVLDGSPQLSVDTRARRIRVEDDATGVFGRLRLTATIGAAREIRMDPPQTSTSDSEPSEGQGDPVSPGEGSAGSGTTGSSGGSRGGSQGGARGNDPSDGTRDHPGQRPAPRGSISRTPPSPSDAPRN